MSEVTGCEAKTIHRLLEVQYNQNDQPEFKKNEMNMLNCDALIVDELSMVDVYIFESVLRAIPMGCRIILVGDSNQLPSVGAGNVLADLISSDTIPYVALNEIFKHLPYRLNNPERICLRLFFQIKEFFETLLVDIFYKGKIGYHCICPPEQHSFFIIV